MMKLNSIAFGSALLIGLFAAVPSFAGESENEKAISQVTDLGDGIKMSQYADQSGFQLDGDGGVRLTYDAKTKTMTMVDADGVSTAVSFEEPETTMSNVEAVVSQR